MLMQKACVSEIPSSRNEFDGSPRSSLWYESGFNQPPEVRAANEEWRTEMDRLAQFLAERCIIGDGFSVQASALYAAYKHWCEENGERILCNNDFARKVAEKGFEKQHYERRWRYLRIRLQSE
jgi:phage/plasmid-associated DNA primase